ncbi:MAG: DUF4494 domain-containing protein [Paludibacteraceae bacterium]|nr:DUF4494 domain-containing protein [Paludibacteraceae bacterium]
MYFLCKISTEKLSQQDGIAHPVNETYLVDALTFAEAETRVLTEQTPFASGGIEVVTCQKVKLTGLVNTQNEAADKWYKVKVMFVNYDEEKQKEKRIANYFYVHAASLPEALKTLQEEEMKNWQTDYDIVAVTDTPIMDVYLYSPDTQNKK